MSQGLVREIEGEEYSPHTLQGEARMVTEYSKLGGGIKRRITSV
jgi:hypothetical protein